MTAPTYTAESLADIAAMFRRIAESERIMGGMARAAGEKKRREARALAYEDCADIIDLTKLVQP